MSNFIGRPNLQARMLADKIFRGANEYRDTRTRYRPKCRCCGGPIVYNQVLDMDACDVDCGTPYTSIVLREINARLDIRARREITEEEETLP